MDETREVKVTDTHIQRFECGCTTTVRKTTLEIPAPNMCGAHHGFLVGEETIKEYAAGTAGYWTPVSVARTIPGA